MIKALECKKCGHKWIPRKNNPSMCPKCKSYKYSEKRLEKEKYRIGDLVIANNTYYQIVSVSDDLKYFLVSELNTGVERELFKEEIQQKIMRDER